ncbi:unnamed protein product [Lupinus luteus]|uniref:Uncharacterized protein n=1 Tax=Lupinus luteus TaxID=3873 RepID=A0AAV1X6F2_LUPLU
MHLSLSFTLNSFEIIKSLNFSCHCLGACLRPYNDLSNLQTLFSCPWIIKPSGCSI